MNDDALAAIVAAAALLRAARIKPSTVRESGSRWGFAARLPVADAAGARVAAGGRSRWTMSGRIRE